MKRIWLILILTIVMLLSACEVSDKTVGLDPSGYHSGTDMQFFQISESAKLPHIQEYNNGCYVYHNGFIYSYDRTNNIIQPLCSKVNCLHDKEQDNERKKACHAYITDTDPQEVSIMMYKDQLYICIDQIISEESFSLDGATIFRIAADGSAREIFYEIDNAEVSFPMLHRGFIYYMRQSFKLSDDSVSSKPTYQRINVDEKDPKPETFHEIPDERQFQGFNTILAYGKYVYFNYSYLDAGGYHNPLFVYDTETKELSENEDVPSKACFYRGSLYFKPRVSGEDDYFEVDIFKTGLNMTNQETVMQSIPQGNNIASDEKYLYLENSILVTWGNEDVKRFWVYDQDMNLIDEFSVPETDTNYLAPPIGGAEYQYQIFDDSETGEWGIYIFDKSKIGSLQGAPYPQEKIVYGVK